MTAQSTHCPVRALRLPGLRHVLTLTAALALPTGIASPQSAPPAGGTAGSAVPQPAATPGSTAPPACPPGMEAAAARGLKSADSNGDGRLSRAEFTRHHEAMFERLPKGPDGQVSLEEVVRPGGMAAGERAGDAVPRGPDGAGRRGTARGMRPEGPRGGSAMPVPMTVPASPGSDTPPQSPAPATGPGQPPPPRTPTDEPKARGSDTGAAASSTSAPSSTPSSSSPTESKPGQRR